MLLLPSCKQRLFQSTLPHGERQSLAVVAFGVIEFQSTLPHGERPTHRKVIFIPVSFNPRSHTGSDNDPKKTWTKYIVVSIHAPTRGATDKLCYDLLLTLFQSTLPHGERLRLTYQAFPLACFNPRSHTGSDELPLHAYLQT